MSVANEQSQLARLERDLIDIDRKIGDKERKEADYFRRVTDAEKSAARAASTSSAASYLRQVEQHRNQISSIKSDKVRLFADKSRKQDEVRRCKERLSREEGYERQRVERAAKQADDRAKAEARKLAADEKRRRNADSALRRQEAAEREALRAEVATLRTANSESDQSAAAPVEDHDFFISHASEDKEGFVRELATALRDAGHDVWYDEFSLQVGDKLRRSIERGIKNSKFGVVVLSPDFFRKEWPQRELDALFELDVGDLPRILPIWHRVSYDEVAAASPMLAGRLALKTALQSMDEIVLQLSARIS